MSKILSVFSDEKVNRFTFIFLILVAILNGCRNNKQDSQNFIGAPPAANEDYFQETGRKIGIDFIHTIGDGELDNIVESVGGGAAFLDYDQDGFMDLYVCNGTWIEGFSKGEKPETMPANRLYRNMQNGTYQDVTKKAGVGHEGYGMGVTVGDYNNDGYPDIYLSNYGPNVLYKNNGNGSFSDVTDRSGVAGNHCSVGATWLDYDNDGLIDLFVGNYLYFDPEYKYFYAPDGFPGPMAYDKEPDFLYRNEGNDKFRDVTAGMGITDIDGRAMGVGSADYDDDGFMDIFVANDHTLNYLWRNEGGKRFTDNGTMSGTAFSQAGEATVSMSVDFADIDGDGLLDIFVSDDSYCALYKNVGNGIFTDVANPSGISTAAAQYVGWSSSFVDYDNDGDVDIFKTNGALKHLYGHEDQLFENDGTGNFEDVSTSRGEYFHQEYVGRGACLADYDNDGDFDIYIVNLNSEGMFLRNNKGNQNNWIMLNLVGTSSNKDALGARIKLTAGGKQQVTQKKSTTGYLSQNDPRIHFGLAKADVVESIEIKWPSGKSQLLENVKVNQILTVQEP